MSASPTAGSGAPDAPGGEPLAPGMANAGFCPARLESRYTPPTRKTKTVRPIAHGGRPPERESIGVWTVIDGSMPGRRCGRGARHGVLGRLAAGVHEEHV